MRVFLGGVLLILVVGSVLRDFMCRPAPSWYEPSGRVMSIFRAALMNPFAFIPLLVRGAVPLRSLGSENRNRPLIWEYKGHRLETGTRWNNHFRWLEAYVRFEEQVIYVSGPRSSSQTDALLDSILRGHLERAFKERASL